MNGQAHPLQALGRAVPEGLVPVAQLQMIALFRVGHGAAAQHGAPQKRPHAAGTVQVHPGRGGAQGGLAALTDGHHAQRGQKIRRLGRPQRQHTFPGAAEVCRGYVVNLRRKVQPLLKKGIDPAGDRHAFAGELNAQLAPAQQVQAAQRHIQRRKLAHAAAGFFGVQEAKLLFAIR